MENVLRKIRKCILFIVAIMFIFYSQPVEAQLLNKLKKSVEKSVERSLEEKVEKETNKAMDTILNSEGNKKQENDEVNNDGIELETSNENESPSDGNNMESDSDKASQNLKPWSKYNFVPGDKIIFHDDLVGEENGEFPSRWDLIKGNVENASLGDENIINFQNGSIITPLMETDEYLPEVFTIEFDAFFDRENMKNYIYNQVFKLRFWDGHSNGLLPDNVGTYEPLHIYRFGAFLNGTIKGQRKEFKSFNDDMMSMPPIWKHIAIAFNKRSLKVFVDDYRALNIPNLGFKPKKVSIEGYTHPLKRRILLSLLKTFELLKAAKNYMSALWPMVNL